MKFSLCSLLLTLGFCFSLFAQISAPAGSIPASGNAVSASGSLTQMDQMARQTVLDLSRVRVDKWKTDGNTKEQNRGNMDSLRKNLSAALPELMQQVQSNPNSVGAAVKLYRNLNVVYDVLASVTESTGAFGSKEDYQALANDVSNLDALRRNFADHLEQMASSQDSVYAQLMNQVRRQQQAAAAAATPPKKVIVDENEPVKKSTSKKKKAAAASSSAQTPSTPK
jgi:hypothetical protein